MKDILIKLLVLSLFSFGTFGFASAACTYDPYTYQTVCDNLQYNNNTGVTVQSVYTNQGYSQTGLYTPTYSGSTQKYPELCSALRRTLIQGDEGQDVRRLQVALGQEGIAYIGATGYYGPVTKNAVKTFQLRNGINPTGNVGPVTMARMRSLWCAGVPTSGVSNPDYYNSSNNGSVEVSIAPISSSAYGVTLGWNSKYANSCTINNESVVTNGQKVYNVSYETNFTITCLGYNNARVTKTITVRPNQAISNQPTVNLYINPTTAQVNSYATLYWTSANTYSCTLNGQGVQTSGSQQILVSYNSTSYLLSCVGQNGQTVSSTIYSNGSGTNTNTGGATASITASLNNIYSGQGVTLNWTSVNTNSCTVSGGPTTFYGVTGSQYLNPTYTTTYYISCVPYNSGSNITNQVTVYVNGSGSGSGNVTANLYASSQNVNSGSSVTLTWSSINANYCNLTANGNNILTNQSYAGNTLVYPTVNTNYQVTCYNSSNQSANGYIDITVSGGTNSASVTVSPTSSTITSGQSKSLAFTVSNASYCTLNGGVFNNTYYSGNSLNTTLTVTPTVNTTYTATCYNSNGTNTTASATVNVSTNTTTSSVTVEPSAVTINSGSNTTLTLTKTNINSCKVTGGTYNNTAVTGNTLTVSPTTTTTYNFSCVGSDGVTRTDSAVVTVTSTAPQLTISPENKTILYGESVNIAITKQNVNSCTIRGGVYTTATDFGSAPSILVTPTANTTYTFTCVGANNQTVTKSSIITVNSTPSMSVTANPATIVSGNSSTLSVTRQNVNTTTANACSVSGGGYSNTPISNSTTTLVVSPTANTTYTFSCPGIVSGTATANVTVTVVSAPSISVAPAAQTISSGQSVSFVLTKNNITSCSVNGTNIGSLNIWSVSPTTTTTYNFTCNTTTGGTVSDSALITVQ